MATKNINVTHQRARVLTQRVNAALLTHAVSAAQKLDKERETAGREIYGFEVPLTRVAQTIQERFDAYSATQHELQNEQLEDSQAQKHRNDLRDQLRARVSQLSRAMELVHGRETVQELALAGSTPTTPDNLLTFAQNFLNATSDENFALPQPSSTLVTLDFNAARGQIETLSKELAVALGGLIQEGKETQQARNQRNETYNAWLKELRFGRDQARSVLRHASQDALAARILPTDRQLTGDEAIPTTPDAEKTPEPATNA